jgi:hypothetical protein
VLEETVVGSGMSINYEAHPILNENHQVNVPDQVINSGDWRRYAFFDIQE